jgi:chromosome segregation ATPase
LEGRLGTPRFTKVPILETEECGAVTYLDLAQILQNRIIAGLRAERVTSDSLKQPRKADLEVYVATLEKAVAEAEVRSEQWRQEAEAAVKRVESLEANIAALKEAVSEAEAIAEQRRQEAKLAAKRVDDLLAEIFEMTSELVEMSRRIAEQPERPRRVEVVNLQ